MADEEKPQPPREFDPPAVEAPPSPNEPPASQKPFSWTVIWTGSALAISLASAVFAFQSVQQAMRSADIAEHTLRVSQRAYLAPTSFEWLVLKPNESLSVRVRSKNSGATPALYVGTKSTVVVTPPQLPIKDVLIHRDPPLDQRPSLTTVQPNTIVTSRPGTEREVSLKDIENIRSGELKVYVFGHLEYRDVFDTPHTTTYCVLYRPDRDVFITCEHGNDMD